MTKELAIDKSRRVTERVIVPAIGFDDAEAFLKTFPDSHWRREAEKQLVLQKEQHAFSREEARRIRSREKARKERTP